MHSHASKVEETSLTRIEQAEQDEKNSPVPFHVFQAPKTQDSTHQLINNPFMGFKYLY